jgi:RNA polymerase I-specific transcription initiation factor RRN11
MSSDKYSFLFALPEAKQTLSARKVHIRRLYDILELCIYRNDISRAKKAWSILIRCKEINWKAMWRTATLLVGEHENSESLARHRLEFLTTMMLQLPEAVSELTLCRTILTAAMQRESIIQEMILHLIVARQHRKALDELELFVSRLFSQSIHWLIAHSGIFLRFRSRRTRFCMLMPA